jgi:hypothetical protein
MNTISIDKLLEIGIALSKEKDDDKQLLLDAINETSYSNGYDNDFPGGKVEITI